MIPVGGVLFKKGSKHLAQKLKDSDNPMAQLAGTVIDVAGEEIGDAITVPMETSEKPVTLVNKDAQPLAVQKPAAPPPPEPIMTKAPPVNPVTAKTKVDSDQKTDNVQV